MGEAFIEIYFAAYIPPGHFETTEIITERLYRMARSLPSEAIGIKGMNRKL
jgi:hypothetical protein